MIFPSISRAFWLLGNIPGCRLSSKLQNDYVSKLSFTSFTSYPILMKVAKNFINVVQASRWPTPIPTRAHRKTKEKTVSKNIVMQYSVTVNKKVRIEDNLRAMKQVAFLQNSFKPQLVKISEISHLHIIIISDYVGMVFICFFVC